MRARGEGELNPAPSVQGRSCLLYTFFLTVMYVTRHNHMCMAGGTQPSTELNGKAHSSHQRVIGIVPQPSKAAGSGPSRSDHLYHLYHNQCNATYQKTLENVTANSDPTQYCT